MSILQMVTVWEHDFPHPEQAVMLALADHAHDDGEGMRPAIDRLAWKTGYARRNIQLILKRLKASGVVVETKPATHNEPAHLKFDWSKARPKQSYETYKAGKERQSSQGCKDDIPTGDAEQGCKDDIPTGDAEQGCKNDTPEKDAVEGCKDDTSAEAASAIDGSSRGCKDYTPIEETEQGCKDYTPHRASEVIDGSPQGCNSDHLRGDQEIISGVIHRSPDPSFKPSIEPSREPKTPLAPQGGTLSPPASPKIIPSRQTEQPEECFQKLDSPKPHHSDPTGEPAGAGEDKHAGRGLSQRKKRKPRGKIKQAAAAYERRLALDPDFEARCDRLRAQWAPFINQLRGAYCDPQAFRRGYAWLLSEWAGQHRMTPEEVEAGLSYYVESKLAQIQAGQQPTAPPDGIRFFTGKAEDSDHPTPYCWLALQRKRDRSATGELPVRRKKYGIDRQAFVERMRQKQAQQEAQNA